MRLPNFSTENNLLQSGYRFIAGTDEVGRGAWAGPVVAAAVIFNPKDIQNPAGKDIFSKINDSKKLTPQKREELFPQIVENCVSYGIGEINVATIDTVGIGKASKMAMMQALLNLNIFPDYLLLDYFELNTKDLLLDEFVMQNSRFGKLLSHQQGIKFGDSSSLSIAAASIIAKVYRDNLMSTLHEQLPNYNFKSNKGYPSKEHIAALESYGPLDIHRKSFSPIRQLKLI